MALRAAGVGLAATAVAAVLPASVGYADPAVNVAAAQARLQALSDKAEVLIERYDAVQDQLAGAQKSLTADQARITLAQHAVDATRAAVDAVAAAAYKTGGVGAVASMVSTGDAQQSLGRMTTLSLLADQRAQQLHVATAARNQLAQAQAAATQQLTKIHALQVSLKGQQKAIDALVGQQQQLVKVGQAQQAAAAAKALAQAKAAAQARANARAHAAAVARLRALQLAQQQAAAARSASRGALAAVQGAPVAASFSGVAQGRAAAALRYAFAQLGHPYRYGAAGPRTFDCSGLTMRAWQAAGVSLSHNAAAQYYSTPHVPRSQLQPGDLVYFGHPIHHVGIYIGGGRFIEAPYTGASVRISSLGSRRDFVGASRP